MKLSSGASQPIDGIGATVNFLLLSGALFWAWPLLKANYADFSSPLALAIRRGTVISGVLFLVYAFRHAGVHMMFAYRMFVPILFVVGMIVAAHVTYNRLVPTILQATLQVGVALFIVLVGMNPMPIRQFGPLGTPFHEYGKTTSAEYGAFIDVLRADANDILAHWRDTGGTGTPRIYVHTAGMGYWLPGFYVYDALVSYRHQCTPDIVSVYGSTTYVQDLDILSVIELLREHYAKSHGGTPEFETISLSTFQMDTPWTIYYKYAPPRAALNLPPTVHGSCGKDGKGNVEWF